MNTTPITAPTKDTIQAIAEGIGFAHDHGATWQWKCGRKSASLRIYDSTFEVFADDHGDQWDALVTYNAPVSGLLIDSLRTFCQ